MKVLSRWNSANKNFLQPFRRFFADGRTARTDDCGARAAPLPNRQPLTGMRGKRLRIIDSEDCPEPLLRALPRPRKLRSPFCFRFRSLPLSPLPPPKNFFGKFEKTSEKFLTTASDGGTKKSTFAM
jgi:hypothetical protein